MSFLFRIICTYFITITQYSCNKHLHNYRKVYYGTPADIRVYPFVVVLLIKPLDRNDGKFYTMTHFCGGSIMSPTWVITSGFCIIKYIVQNEIGPRDWFVRCGTNDWKATNATQKYMRDYHIKDFFVHENSNFGVKSFYKSHGLLPPKPSSYDYDIGLVKIEGQFIFNSGTRYIKLAAFNFKYRVKAHCEVLGYGKTETAETNTRLQIAKTKIENYTACSARYRKEGHTITARMFCAGFLEGGPSHCDRDIGGPLIQNIGKTQVLIGISSFGKGCGTRGYPPFYTKISEFQKWIMEFEKKVQFYTNH